MGPIEINLKSNSSKAHNWFDSKTILDRTRPGTLRWLKQEKVSDNFHTKYEYEII